MVFSVVNQWAAGFSINAGFAYTTPVGEATQVSIGNTAGNWLIALAAWQAPGDSPATVAFGDDASNHWFPVGAPAGTSSAAGNVRAAIWAAPCAAAATRVWAAPTGWAPAVGILILEVSGLSPGYSLQAVDTGWANAATSASVSLTAPSPAGTVLALACCGTDNNTATVTMSGTGWSALATVTTSDGSDHLADLTLTSGWQIATGAVSATWTATGASPDFGACGMAVLVTQPAPAGPSQGWPHVRFEAAFGSGMATPWDQLSWTDLTARYRGLSGQRGKQYELDSVQASSMSLMLSNNDGALTPGNTASAYYLGTSGWNARNNVTVALSRQYAWTGATSMLMGPDGVTSGPYIESAQYPVTSSTAGYQAYAAVYCPAGWNSVAATIRWYNASGGHVSDSSGTNIAVTAGQWAYPQASGTSPSTAAFATVLLVANGTPASTTLFWWDACQLTAPNGSVLNANTVFATGPDVFTPARLLATWQGRTYVAWRGYIERWPSQLSSSRYTSANTTATDVYAGLTSLQPTVAAGEILLDDPWGYWPCSDPAGSTMAANLAPGGGASALTVVQSKFGPGPSGAQAFGGDTSVLLGAAAGCWTQSGLNTGSTDIQHGYCLQSTATTSAPSITGGITIECLVQFAAVAQPNGRLLIWALQGTAGTIAEFWGDYDGSGAGIGWYLTVYDKGTRAGTSYHLSTVGIESGIGGISLGTWYAWTITLTPAAWTAWLEAGGIALTTASGTCNLAPSFQWVTWGGAADRILTGQSSNLSLAGLAVFPSVLTQTRMVAHFFSYQNGLAGDAAHNRIGRLMSYASMLVPRRLSVASDSLEPATDIQGQAVAQNITKIAQSDTGLLSVDRAGYLAFDSREYRWNRGIAWDVGEQAGAYLNANWDFEAGISPWTAAGGATVTASAAQSWSGAQSLLITPPGGVATPGAVSEKCALAPGSEVSGTVMLLCPGGWASGAVTVLTFYSVTGSPLATATGAVPLNPGTAWVSCTASGIAPGSTAWVSLTVQLAGTPGSSVLLYADLAQLWTPGEIPYGADFSPDFDPSQVFNDLTITEYSGVAVAVSSPTSMTQYGDQTLQETVYLIDPDTVTDLSDWILAQYGQPELRIAQFTVDAKANPWAWQFVLTADVGTVVQVSRRLQGTQTVIQDPFVIQSVTPALAPGQWQVTYMATPYLLGARATNDPVRGLPTGENAIAFLPGAVTGAVPDGRLTADLVHHRLRADHVGAAEGERDRAPVADHEPADGDPRPAGDRPVVPLRHRRHGAAPRHRVPRHRRRPQRLDELVPVLHSHERLVAVPRRGPVRRGDHQQPVLVRGGAGGQAGRGQHQLHGRPACRAVVRVRRGDPVVRGDAAGQYRRARRQR